MSLDRETGARIVRDWMHDAIKDWVNTQKGNHFWFNIWKELNEIGHGRAP